MIPVTGPYGVVIAMHAEARHLLDQADSLEQIDGEAYHCWKATFGPATAIVVVSGIGMVLAAAATQWLISTHRPTAILNFGCTGAHRPDIGLGEVIVGTKSVAHFNIQILPNGDPHYVGFVSEDGVDLLHVTSDNFAHVSRKLLERAVHVISSREIEPWPDSPSPPEWHLGPVASADIWTQQQSILTAIHEEHQTLCEDMEAAAIGRIANVHGIPFLTVKDISNNEFQKQTNLADFTEFPYAEVGKRSGQVIADLLRAETVEP